jgi:hypothetical protein
MGTKTTVLWNVIPCSSVDQLPTLQAESFSETLVALPVSQIVLPHIPQDSNVCGTREVNSNPVHLVKCSFS